jgi:hypothetical protein
MKLHYLTPVEIMKSAINNDLSKLNEWTKLWLVDFNPKKTKALVISTSAVPHIDLRFNGEPVEIVKKTQTFGINFCIRWKLDKSY